MHQYVRGVVWGLVLLAASAAQAGLISGKITAVSKDGTSVTVETSKGPRTFKVAETAAVTLDDKKVDRARLSVGMRLSVFTDTADKPTRFVARTEKTADAVPPVPAKPDGGKTESDTAKAETKRPKSAGRASRSSHSSSTSQAGDWPQYLGPNRDNTSTETGLLRKWPANGPEVAWKASGLGSGYSSVSIAEGLIYTMGNHGQNQALLALDLETGDGKWSRPVGPAFQEGNGNGPRSTPTVVGNRVYALGARGELMCADAKSGAPVWSKNILQEYGGQALGWGICESVLIDGDRLICTPGGPRATMVALDRNTGRQIWAAVAPEGDTAGYASAIRIEVDGVPQYVQFTNRGTIAVRADDGRFLWRDNSAANGTANCSTPQFFDDMVFSASGYGHGGAMVRLTSARGMTTAQFGYHTKDMKSHHGGFVIRDGYVYGSNEGVFACIDLKTGDTRWQNRSPGKGSLTCVDGMLIVRNEGGAVTLVEVNPQKYVELSKFNQGDRSNNQAWAYPVVSHGKLFLRDMDLLICYDLRGK